MKNSIQDKPTFNISTINEIMQDTDFFYMLLETKRKLKNIEAKSYLTMFIKGLAVAINYELSVCLENCGILEKDKFFKSNMKNKVRKERQWLHQNICNSNKINKKIQEMGLDFSNEVYDLNVVIKNNKILDINFEQFGEDENLDFWNSVFYLNEQVIETIFKVFDEKFESNISKKLYKMTDAYISEKILNSIKNKINGKRYSYQSYKLFSKSTVLDTIDKIFILYRYRLISSIILIEKVFYGKELKISIDPLFNLDFKNYIRKYKAISICIVGDELMKMNTDFSNSILKDISNQIDAKFFPLNRKVRDNIHYSRINEFSNEEIEYLDTKQSEYLNIIYKHFINKINLDINNDDIFMTNFLKCCKAKGLNAETIKENYEKLYLEYYLTGKI